MGSGQQRFIEVLGPLRRISVDTNCCLYYMQRGSRRGPLATEVIDRAALRELSVDVPGIVHLELLVQPYRNQDRRELGIVRRFLDGSHGVGVTPVSSEVLAISAEVRALTRLRVPDAMVVGSAIVNGSEAIIGNDKRFRRVNDLANLRMVTLDRGVRSLPSYVHLDDYLDDV